MPVCLKKIYAPLYDNEDKFIILVTGGRASGKSFATSAFINHLSYNRGHIILYTRYTMESATISVIPEFREKMEIEGSEDYFDITQRDIVNKVSGSRILFRGIKTSSGNQTAKLKSITGLTTFVVDEAEEFVSEKDYDTIVYSLRQKGIQNRVLIIMNPAEVTHFIYRRYIEKTHKIVEYDGVPVQISTHPNVLHIHTSYLDNLENLGDEFLRGAEEVKAEDPKKYAHVFMGQWATLREGVIFERIDIVDVMPDYAKRRGYGLDFGFSKDPTAIVDCALVGNDLYLDEICYRTKMLTDEIITELKRKPQKTICDSEDPRLIQEIANAGILAYPASKGPDSVLAGIQKMRDLHIKVTRRSINLLYEFRNYTWDKDKDGNYISKPIDQYNHCIDAARYWVWHEVLGKIQTEQGYKKRKLNHRG